MEILLILPGFILAIINLVILGDIKPKKPRNKVHFYVARDKDRPLWLYLGKPVRGEDSFESNEHGCAVSHSSSFEDLGLNIDDYKDLEWEDEPKEVFLNLED